jgi:hypothetical protein
VLSDRAILAARGPKARLDSARAYASTWEEEPDARGSLIPTAVVFLTNRECPFRCLMCDLWVNTLDETVPRGAIPSQIRAALVALTPARPAGAAATARTQIKLYNAGSYFDPQAIPAEDDGNIAGIVAGFERVIVESHPAFLAGVHGERCLRFRDRLRGRLEVAVGLETAHPDVLARLNKRMTLDGFRRAAAFLAANEVDLRVFILLNPPYLAGSEAVEWACRSIDEAIECGAVACSVIPTRAGNGAVEAIGDAYQKPSLAALERVLEYGLSRGRARVFADLWDVERFFDCTCSPQRSERLSTMNRTQRIAPPLACPSVSCLGVGSW